MLALTPGIRLRSSVLLAMTGLDAHEDPTSVGNELRGALAYTAAIGETCMVTEAAEAVRLAVRCLACGEADEARAALTEAEKQVLALGATRVTEAHEEIDFRVFRDPAGHTFCLIDQTAEATGPTGGSGV